MVVELEGLAVVEAVDSKEGRIVARRNDLEPTCTQMLSQILWVLNKYCFSQVNYMYMKLSFGVW